MKLEKCIDIKKFVAVAIVENCLFGEFSVVDGLIMETTTTDSQSASESEEALNNKLEELPNINNWKKYRWISEGTQWGSTQKKSETLEDHVWNNHGQDKTRWGHTQILSAKEESFSMSRDLIEMLADLCKRLQNKTGKQVSKESANEGSTTWTIKLDDDDTKTFKLRLPSWAPFYSNPVTRLVIVAKDDKSIPDKDKTNVSTVYLRQQGN